MINNILISNIFISRTLGVGYDINSYRYTAQMCLPHEKECINRQSATEDSIEAEPLGFCHYFQWVA